jgi:hypothetical protein
MEALMRLELIPFMDRGQIFSRMDQTAASTIHRGESVLDDTVAPLGPEGQRRIRIPSGLDAGQGMIIRSILVKQPSPPFFSSGF